MAGEVRKQTWDDLENTQPLPVVPESSLEDTQPLPVLRQPSPRRRRRLRWVGLAVAALVLGFVARLAWSDFLAPRLLPPPRAGEVRVKSETAAGATIARAKTTQEPSQPLKKAPTMPVARSNNQGGQKYKPRGGASLASGKSYVRANCLGCHRVDGEGSGIDLSKVGNKYSVAALKYYLKYEHPMPWKGSDAEREAVARYLVSLQSGSQAAFASHNEEAKGRETEGKAAKNGGEFRQLAQDMPVPDAPTGLTVTPAIVAADKGSFWAGRPRYMDIELRLSWNSVSGAAYYKAYVYGYSNGTSYYLPGYESGFQIPEFETGAGINRELKMDASGRCFATLGPITFVGKDIPKALIVWVVGVNEAGEGYRSKPAIVSIPNPWE